MTNIFYIGSSGNAYKLRVDRMLRIHEANFHEYEWKYEASELQFGANIDRFTKEVAVYEFELVFTGSAGSRQIQIDTIHAEFERDIVNKSPGRIVWGDCYIDGYAVGSSTSPFDGVHVWTKNAIKFICPYPFWIQERNYSFVPISQEVRETDKQYTATHYGYPYSYALGNGGISIDLDYYAGCDFKLTAFGAFSELYITMGGNVYNVNYPVDSDSYMVVDSRQNGNMKGQAYVMTGGSKINVFDYRNPYHSLYAKIPAGITTIQYPRTYGIDLTLFMERSEPVVGDAANNYAALLESQGDILTVLR